MVCSRFSLETRYPNIPWFLSYQGFCDHPSLIVPKICFMMIFPFKFRETKNIHLYEKSQYTHEYTGFLVSPRNDPCVVEYANSPHKSTCRLNWVVSTSNAYRYNLSLPDLPPMKWWWCHCKHAERLLSC